MTQDEPTFDAQLLSLSLYLVFDSCPDVMLEQLVEGDPQAIEALQSYAREILERRRLADAAPSN